MRPQLVEHAQACLFLVAVTSQLHHSRMLHGRRSCSQIAVMIVYNALARIVDRRM